jgi:hypothetical protein
MDKGTEAIVKKQAPVFELEHLTGEVPLNEKPSPPATLADFDNLLITAEKDIPADEVVIEIAGAKFASQNNISAISAAPKGAKTAVMNAMVAGSISDDGEVKGFPDIQVKPNIDKKAVICIDTEQSQSDQQYNVKTILKRSQQSATPEYLRCYNFTQLDFVSYQEKVSTICELSAIHFKGIHSIYIDGGADFIASVNDEEQSKQIVQFFRHLSLRFTCPVIVIVHQNPGSEKERGHFGSELQRKIYGLLSIEKKGDMFLLNGKMLRRSGNGDVPVINFQYNQEHGYHMQVEAEDQEAAKDLARRQKLELIAQEVFKPFVSYREVEAYSAIMQHTSKGKTTAKNMLYDMEGFGFIEKGTDKLYRITLNRSTGQKQVKNSQPDL